MKSSQPLGTVCKRLAASSYLAAMATAGTSQSPDMRLPARDVYKNIKVFVSDRVSASYLDELMDEISTDLGVSCMHCHDGHALHREDLEPEKVRARELIGPMWRIVGSVNPEYFPGEGGPVRCWTCHRGSPIPETTPPSDHQVEMPRESPFRNDQAAASDVYQNLQVLKDLPADQLEETMMLFSLSLDVGCEACHVTGDGDSADWASDERELKQRARTMLRMVETLAATHFDGLRAPTCWTCHRGSGKPDFLRPE